MTRWIATLFLALAMALTPITASLAMSPEHAPRSPIASLTPLGHKASSLPCHGKADHSTPTHAATCCPVCTASPTPAISAPLRAATAGSPLPILPVLALNGWTVPPPDDPPRR